MTSPGSFPSLLSNKDPFAFLGLFLGVMLVSVNITDSSFWYNLESRLRQFMHVAFATFFALSFIGNWFLIEQERNFYKAGLNLRYLLYAFWVVVYTVLFGGIQLLVYKIHTRRLQGTRSTLSRINMPDSDDRLP